MEELGPIVGSPVDFQQSLPPQQSASDAFGLQFEALLQIVLTQLQFQDPLQPLENFEFVSQLAQFSQIQQVETSNEHLQTILQSDAASQAVGLLGLEVELPAGATSLLGTVTAISFTAGEPRLTVETENGQTIENISLNNIFRIEQGEV